MRGEYQGWIHAEGKCARDCPECAAECGGDVEYTVTVEVTVRAATDEEAADQVEEALDAAGMPGCRFLIITAHG
jgi:hypothetical protein